MTNSKLYDGITDGTRKTFKILHVQVNNFYHPDIFFLLVIEMSQEIYFSAADGKHFINASNGD